MFQPSSAVALVLDDIIGSIPWILPEIVLSVTFLLLLVVSILKRKKKRGIGLGLTLLGLGMAGYQLLQQSSMNSSELLLFASTYKVDTISTKYSLLITLFTALLASYAYFSLTKEKLIELFALLIATTLGMYALCSSTHWLMTFIAIETVSLCSYAMVGYLSKNRFETEAAMKYALFGATCSAIMLYGISLTYAQTGTLNFTSPEYLMGLAEGSNAMISLSILFILIGFAFKLSMIPVHFWTPDVYQGAPTVVTAFIASVPKIAVSIMLFRWVEANAYTAYIYSDVLIYSLVVLSLASMWVGNLAALVQSNAKRLMAYSSIGHTGIIIMLILFTRDQHNSFFYYLTAYSIATIGVFIAIDVLENKTGSQEINSYYGLGAKIPVLFICFTILLTSLAGIPPLMGFVGKLLVFSEAFKVYQYTGDVSTLLLLISGTLTTVISLFYYFKIPLYAFLKQGGGSPRISNKHTALYTAIIILTIFTIILGVFPQIVFNIYFK